MTLTQQDFTSENLRELEQDAERLAASLEQAANELRVGVIDVGLSQVSRDLAEFVRAFDSAAKAVGAGTRSLDDLRKALDRRQGRSTLERALRIQGTVAVDLDAVGTVVQAALDDYPPQPEIIAAIDALLALIEDPELDFQRKMALGEQAGRILQKDVVLAAQLGGLTLAVASPEVVLSVDTPQEPLPPDPDPSPPAPALDEPPQDVGSILNPYTPPDPPIEPSLISSASVAEFKKLKREGKLPTSTPEPSSVEEAQSAGGDVTTVTDTEEHGVEPVAIPVEEEIAPTVSHEVESTQEVEGDPVEPEIPTTEPVMETSADEDELEVPEVSTDLADQTQLSRQIWEAVGKNSVSLAYHSTRHFDVPSPNLTALRFALLGRNIMNADSDLLDAFIHDLEEDPHVGWWDTADAVLGFSGLLPAALADPRVASLALSAIQRLNLPSELHRFRNELTRLVNDLHGHSFLEELELAKTYLKWLGEEERLKRNLDEELRTAPLRTMSYAPATKVWQSFWHPDGVLHRLVAPAADSVRGPVKARSMLPDEIDRLIQDTYRSHDSRRRDTIHTSALRQLQMKVEEALGLVQEFSAHRASEPVIDRHVRGVVDFVRQWRDLRPDIIAGSGLYAAEVQASLRWLDGRLDALAEIIGGKQSGETYSLRDTVGRALLRSNIPMDGHGEALLSNALREHLLEAMRHDAPWTEAFEDYLRTGNLESAWFVIRELDEGQRAGFEERWQAASEEQRTALQRLLDQVRQLFDVSSYQGLLTESEIQRYEQRLTEMQQATSAGIGKVNFGVLRDEALEKLESLEMAFTRRIDTLQKRLSVLKLEPEVVERIQRKLDERDVQTAQEYLGYAERHETLPDVEEDSAAQFMQFFPAMLEAIERYLVETRLPDRVIGDLKSRSSRYVPDISSLPGAQINSAVDLMAVWHDVKRQPQQFGPAALRRIFESLGFTVQRSDPYRIAGSNPVAWQVETVPVADRAMIPVENYGSRAEGHYRVIPVWERPSEDSLINMIGNSPLPTFILYFGRLSQQRRRDLAVMARERRKVVVVIDELLMMALTGIRGSRLPVLFRLGMPFSAFEPYTVTGSNVSPEMFFGREQEINDILDPRGASFLYGGRQLGKSALLRHVERMHHQPKAGIIVRWIDLKSKEVGHGQDPDHLWTVLMRELQPFDVFSSQYSNPKPETFQRAVKAWLEESPTRRILLLLDEADQFLRLEGERLIDGIPAYTNTSYLKNLMETTDRRFKVVFAGTHNVLKAHRSSTSTNSPLVHLGHPIEIGPMLGSRERRQAYALITDPFALQGYRFEPSDLPYRILARTNYYPSLIQIYGHHLMRYLQERRTQLPFTIRSAHVDGVFRDRELAKDIRDRLLWTLRLDVKGRYEATAYGLAEAAARGEVNLETGVTTDQLYQLASYWHPDGFVQTDRQEMRSVVEEMKGLGILRETEPDIYTFRTPNVALMLGTRKEIDIALLDLQERHSRQAELGPVSHRTALAKHPTWAAPLTSRQLFEVIGNQNGLKVVVSSKATNSHLLQEFLVDNVGTANVVTVPVHSDIGGFRQYMDRELSRRDSYRLYLVTPDSPWTADWVKAAQEKLKRMKDRSVTRFVFHGGPEVLRDRAEFGDDLIVASPWNTYELHSWLESQGYSSGIDICRSVEAVSGNWPANLQVFFKKLRGQGIQDVLAEAEGSFGNSDWVRQRKSDLGLTERQLETLSVLAQAGDDTVGSAQDLLELCDSGQGLRLEDLEITLDMAGALRVVDFADGFYRTSPYLKRLLA